MKKTLLALAIPAALVAAGASAQGVSVYNQDGVNVKVGGEVEVRYTQPYELFTAKKDASMNYDDTYFFIDADMALTDDLSAVAYMKFNADSEADTVAVDDRYVGFASKTMGTLVFGNVATLWDDNAGTEMAYSLDMDAKSYADFAEDQADQAIKYTFENDMFFAGALYALSQDGSADNKNDASITELQLGFRAAGFTVDAFYQNVDQEKPTAARDAVDATRGTPGDLSTPYIPGTPAVVGKYDSRSYALQATYSFDAFVVAAGYQNLHQEVVGAAKDNDVDGYSLAGSYTFGLNTVKAGFDYFDGDEALANADGKTYYVNFGRQIHSNVNVFAEVGHTSQDNAANKSDSDTAYLVGMEVAF